MKKSIIFLINGLGIEKAGSYSISIDQCMPGLARLKETSFFTTAVINSVEYRSAYEDFFLGDTYQKDIKYIRENIINDNVVNNPVFQKIKSDLDSNPTSKLHVFLEPTNDTISDAINDLIDKLSLAEGKEVYIHLLLNQQTVSEYKKLISMINYIKFRLNSRITVGFIMGKELLPDVLSKEELDTLKKMYFYCSCERWSDIEKKLTSLADSNIRPCVAPGFCSTNSCSIQNGDVILFFNTKSTNYDRFLKGIYQNAGEVFKTQEYKLPLYSLVKLNTEFNIPSFTESIEYDNSLSSMLTKSGKKCLILSDPEHISLVNFLANGYKNVNNPSIQFMKLDTPYLSVFQNVINLIDNTDYDLIIFDYHMDVSKTINDLKVQLEQIDKVIENIGTVSENKHSLFITSLYGLKKELPLAPYNSEMVTLDYEMQIPIFFYDYTYPRSKYTLAPGETNSILNSAMKCIWDNPELDSLIRLKGLLNNLFKK